jgi:uncharacterized membrane protein required for colicin V production
MAVNLADAGVVIVLAGVILIGLKRGLVGQCLLLAATLISLLVAAVTAYLVATQADAGHGLARLAAPLAFFIALGLASWLLKRLALGMTRIVHSLPFASVDRLLGAAVSVAVGVIILSLLVLGLLSIPAPNPVTDEVAGARSTVWLLEIGGWAAATGARHVDLLDPLARRFAAAAARVGPPGGVL